MALYIPDADAHDDRTGMPLLLRVAAMLMPPVRDREQLTAVGKLRDVPLRAETISSAFDTAADMIAEYNKRAAAQMLLNDFIELCADAEERGLPKPDAAKHAALWHVREPDEFVAIDDDGQLCNRREK